MQITPLFIVYYFQSALLGRLLQPPQRNILYITVARLAQSVPPTQYAIWNHSMPLKPEYALVWTRVCQTRVCLDHSMPNQTRVCSGTRVCLWTRVCTKPQYALKPEYALKPQCWLEQSMLWNQSMPWNQSVPWNQNPGWTTGGYWLGWPSGIPGPLVGTTGCWNPGEKRLPFRVAFSVSKLFP